MRISLLKSAILVIASACIMTGHACAQSYTLTDLGAGVATGINNAGQVAGTGTNGSAILWNGDVATVLPAIGHHDSATAINDQGIVVGYDTASCHGCLSGHHAVEWNNPTPENVSTDGGELNRANAVNNAGVVAGDEYTKGNATRSHAVVWNNGQQISLGTLNTYTYSDATAINNNGQVAGYLSGTGSLPTQAVLWNGTTPTVLDGLVQGANSQANAINDKGQVVGYSDTETSRHRLAVLWNGTTATALPSLGGSNSDALAINGDGDIVGYSTAAGSKQKQAVLWNGTTLINLNSYLTAGEIGAGWVLEEATGINSNGAIVGISVNTLTGKEDAFILNVVSNVAEPTSMGMYLSGLMMLGLIVLRRKSAPLFN